MLKKITDKLWINPDEVIAVECQDTVLTCSDNLNTTTHIVTAIHTTRNAFCSIEIPANEVVELLFVEIKK